MYFLMTTKSELIFIMTVVKVTVLLSDITQFQDMNKAYGECKGYFTYAYNNDEKSAYTILHYISQSHIK